MTKLLMDLIFKIALLSAGGYLTLNCLHKMQVQTIKRIQGGFSSTYELNRKLWENSRWTRKNVPTHSEKAAF